MADYKVLLTTSGLGSRLGNLTKFTNKSLVRIGDKAVISHIIESYPQDVEFVVTLGHYGSHVRQYLTLAHSDRKIQFIEIDNYVGEGSSLLYSISLCEEYLQTSFVFHACDTILPKNYINDVDFSSNWSIGGSGENSQSYRTINAVNGKIASINEKGEQNFDYVYVGVSGIKDYQEFWRICNDTLSTIKTSDLSDCHVIREMNNFNIITIDDWYDIGNVDALKRTRSKIKGTVHVLDKEDENIFVFDDFVIKFFYNKKICSDRVARTKNLRGLVPTLLGSTENFYKYQFVKADLLANSINLLKFVDLLSWSKQNLWIQKEDESYEENALSFYKDKTLKRIDKFLEKYNLEDSVDIINGIEVPPIKEVIEQINFESLIGKNPTGFHGDFILDNILIGKNGFTLIDWRQDFNGSIDAGDMNYDLAKLNHNLTLSHQVLADNHFKISCKDEVTCDVYVKKTNIECQEYLQDFCYNNKIDYSNIKILSSIIWINMAPLHEHPLDMFLYYFGKYNLFLNLK
jgi:CTP:phosphocholine cytidylyltransferase-like protein